jgi:beta-glucosidase
MGHMVLILKKVLMDNWGFRGFVVSDWWATKDATNTESCLNAGLSLEMPVPIVYNTFQLSQAYKEKKFSEESLNNNIRRILRVMFLVGLFDEESTLLKGSRNTPEHQALAREIAEEGIVLLKNEGKLLPINTKKIEKIAIIGPTVSKKTYLGGGSSDNFPPYEIKPIVGIKEKCKGKVEIIKSSSEAEITVLFVGLRHQEGMDREGEDKSSFFLPEDQISLITKTVKENPNTIVVLTGGSPVSMINWIDKVPAVIQAWYGGMEAGNAIANILFGDVNPSGKLPITFPKALSDSPAHVSEGTYPGDENLNVFYEEGIFVGYRHFDTKEIKPLFPFGHGLSYTKFTYENLKLSKEKLTEDEKLIITLEITNSGDVFGAEIIQLYIRDLQSSVERPLKELKGFRKIGLQSGEKSTVSFEIIKEDLSFFDETIGNWVAEMGEFEVLIGSSSKDIKLRSNFEYLG